MRKLNMIRACTVRSFRRLVFMPVFALAMLLNAILAAADGWNLDEIYPDQQAWAAESRLIDAVLQDIEELGDKPVRNADDLAELLAAVSDVRGRAGRMAKVGLLQSIVDTTSQEAERRREEGEAKEAEVERNVAFVEPVVRQVGERELRRWISSSASLRLHERRINRILRTSRHAWPEGAGSFEADLMRLPRTANDFYEALRSSDLNWPAFDGGVITPGNFTSLSRSPVTRSRREASRIYFEHLHVYERLFGLVLLRRIEGELLSARRRGLSDPIDLLLVIQDGMPPQSYKALFTAIEQGRPKIAYVTDVLRRAYGLDDITLDDLRARVSTVDRRFSIEESRRITLQAASRLGSEYRDIMASRLDQPWAHLGDDENKSSTGGVFWQVGGGNPHTVMKHRGDYSSSRIYAAAALLMTNVASVPDERAPDRREEDLPVFSNGLWYLGQYLHDDVLLGESRNQAERVAILSDQLSRTLVSLVNYGAMVRLEAEISRQLSAGQSLTGSDISDLYYSILLHWYGGGNIAVPGYWRNAWMNESFAFYGPHYSSFYEAITAALVMKRRIDANDPGMRDVILNGVADSDTHYSFDVLSGAGIDLSAVSTYEDAISEMESVAKRLERVLPVTGLAN
jgi:oligoendopeptidase F